MVLCKRCGQTRVELRPYPKFHMEGCQLCRPIYQDYVPSTLRATPNIVQFDVEWAGLRQVFAADMSTGFSTYCKYIVYMLYDAARVYQNNLHVKIMLMNIVKFLIEDSLMQPQSFPDVYMHVLPPEDRDRFWKGVPNDVRRIMKYIDDGAPYTSFGTNWRVHTQPASTGKCPSRPQHGIVKVHCK